MAKDPWNPKDKEIWEPYYEGYLTWARFNNEPKLLSYREFVKQSHLSIYRGQA